jgi:hypothetical protein
MAGSATPIWIARQGTNSPPPAGLTYNLINTAAIAGAATVAPFESRVIGVEPHVGYVCSLGRFDGLRNLQGYMNFKFYSELDARDRRPLGL